MEVLVLRARVSGSFKNRSKEMKKFCRVPIVKVSVVPMEVLVLPVEERGVMLPLTSGSIARIAGAKAMQMVDDVRFAPEGEKQVRLVCKI
jgi:hypothetical protein